MVVIVYVGLRPRNRPGHEVGIREVTYDGVSLHQLHDV